jgi:hypothetical protein
MKKSVIGRVRDLVPSVDLDIGGEFAVRCERGVEGAMRLWFSGFDTEGLIPRP